MGEKYICNKGGSWTCTYAEITQITLKRTLNERKQKYKNEIEELKQKIQAIDEVIDDL